MSDRVETSRVRIAVLILTAIIAFAVLVAGFAALVRAVCAPKFLNVKPQAPIEPKLPSVPSITATETALAEVKKREGWTGFAEAESGESEWYIWVWRKPASQPRSLKDRWVVIVDGETGKVVEYVRPGGTRTVAQPQRRRSPGT
jgi:hypothetical protein